MGLSRGNWTDFDMHTHTGYNTGKANYKSDLSGLVTVVCGVIR